MERTFRIGPIRPPSEANSLLIQVTQGCTWNKCKFCQLYRDTGFKAYSAESIRENIDSIAHIAEKLNGYYNNRAGWDIEGINACLERMNTTAERESFYTVANWLIAGAENVFLQDGNTTVLSSGRLSDVLRYLRSTFPSIKRITSYGRAGNLARLSPEDFAELKDAGLDRIHSGYESGCNEVLRMVNKGVTAEEEIQAGINVKAGGIELSVYFMPGLGGHELTEKNAEDTARVINAVNPNYLRVRTCAVKPGTELYEDYEKGKFQLCSDEEKLIEIRTVIEMAEGIDTVIVSDHMVNLLQNVEGHMVNDKAAMLNTIGRFLDLPKDERRKIQAYSRTLGRSQLLAGEWTDDEWTIKMNEYISYYI